MDVWGDDADYPVRADMSEPTWKKRGCGTSVGLVVGSVLWVAVLWMMLLALR